MYLKGIFFCLLILFLISCNDGTIDSNIVDEDDKILSQVIISVVDNALDLGQEVYSDSFEINSPENFIDISKNIVYLQIDSPIQNISNYSLSIDPPVWSPKLLNFAFLPYNNFRRHNTIFGTSSGSSSPTIPEISSIAFFGYTTDSSESIDTLNISLTLNSIPVFTDSTITIIYNRLTRAVLKSIPNTEHPSESSQNIRFLSSDFSTGVPIESGDPRNIYNFVHIKSLNSSAADLNSAGITFKGTTPKDAYFFFANLPEL